MATRSARGRRLVVTFCLALLGLFVNPSLAYAQTIGPTPYLQFSDSPFSDITFNDYFHLETFEDSLLNVPGVSVSTGVVLGPSAATDSVDGDDGVLDGLGQNGHSWFSGNGQGGVVFTFDAGSLGGLPTHVGIVWTDGTGNIEFTVRDGLNTLIGSLTGTHADGSFGGTTGEDRFYGMVAPQGIRFLFIRNFGDSGIEIDHLQIGRGAVVGGQAAPEPGTFALLGVGALGIMLLFRRT